MARGKKKRQTPDNPPKTIEVECTFAQTLKDGNMLYEAGKSYLLCPREIEAYKRFLKEKPSVQKVRESDDCGC